MPQNVSTPTNPTNTWDALAQLFGNGPSADGSQAAPQNDAGMMTQLASFQPPQAQPSAFNQPGSPDANPFMLAGKPASIYSNGGANFGNFNQLMKNVNDQGIGAINDQKGQLSKLQDQVSAMPDHQTRPDLSGLMALADAWGSNGSHMAQDYANSNAKPLSDQQLQALKLAAQEKVSGLQNNLSKDDLALMQDQLRDELQKQLIQAHWGQINQGKASMQDDKVVGQLQGQMLKDKNYVAAQSMQDEGNKIKNLLMQASTGNPNEVTRRFAAQQLPIAIARFNTGGQRINVPEIQRAVGDPDWKTKWDQTIATASGKGLDPVNAQSMGAYLDNVMGSAQGTLDKTQMDYANKVRARTAYDGPTAYEKITGQKYEAPSPTRNAPQVAPLDPSKMTREQKLQYLQGNF